MINFVPNENNMRAYSINEVLKKGKSALLQEVIIKGWVRSFRSNRFIALNDGSTINNIQIVIDFENFDEEILKQLTTATAIRVDGTVIESQGSGQEIEIQAKKIKIYGFAHPDEVQKTILQPKKHSLEFLREQAHLRFRTNLFGSVMRVRNAVSFAIHKYFNENEFCYINTPIITGSDAEGAGEMFNVTNFNLDNYKEIPKTEEGEIDFTKDFFGKKTNLTVSGQLEAEVAAIMNFGIIVNMGDLSGVVPNKEFRKSHALQKNFIVGDKTKLKLLEIKDGDKLILTFWQETGSADPKIEEGA